MSLPCPIELQNKNNPLYENTYVLDFRFNYKNIVMSHSSPFGIANICVTLRPYLVRLITENEEGRWRRRKKKEAVMVETTAARSETDGSRLTETTAAGSLVEGSKWA